MVASIKHFAGYDTLSLRLFLEETVSNKILETAISDHNSFLLLHVFYTITYLVYVYSGGIGTDRQLQDEEMLTPSFVKSFFTETWVN